MQCKYLNTLENDSLNVESVRTKARSRLMFVVQQPQVEPVISSTPLVVPCTFFPVMRAVVAAAGAVAGA